MKFKVGDKVKFLNEKGGGIISKVISASMVHVMTEDGFELPYMPGDLVKVESTGKVSNMFDESFNVALPEEPQRNQEEIPDVADQPPDDRISALNNLSFRRKDPPGAYIAWVPHDQKWLVTGDIEIFIVNHTSFEIVFSMFRKNEEGEWLGEDYDVIPPHSKLLFETIDREMIGGWMEGFIQLMFFEEKPRGIFMPVNRAFKLKPSRISDEKAYTESEFIEEKSLLIPVIKTTELESIVKAEQAEKEGLKKPEPKQVQPEKPASLIDRYRTSPHDAVVDLHIDELLDNTKGMSPHEILQYQLRHFERCIESAIASNYQKVTFIHGVGNGSLKNALIKRLNEYENLENHSASLAKFGVGAIDVVIRPLK
jgi:hypothetical protein